MTSSSAAADVAELVVVPGERHVERLARVGVAAETKTSIVARLVASLLPATHFAEAPETELALGFALVRPPPDRLSAAQMDLFGSGIAASAGADPLLATAKRAGAGAWTRTVAALDDAIGSLLSRGATAADLARVAARAGGMVARRARALADSMSALEQRLAAVGSVDARRTGYLLAEALRSRAPDEVVALVGARRIQTRWIVSWTPADLVWWRVLDDALSRAGGWARVQLPSFERPLEGDRERDPLEELAETVAGRLDAAPDADTIAPVLGDLTGTPPESPSGRVRILRASDAVSQARTVAREVREALLAGASVERTVVAASSIDEATLRPLRQAFDELGIVCFETRGPPASSSPLVVAALSVLDAAESLDRDAVAAVLRCPLVDPRGLVDGAAREAVTAVQRTARALERTPTAAGADAKDRLVRTARAGGADEGVVARVIDVLSAGGDTRTRIERIRGARALWTSLGFGARAGRGGLAAFSRDVPPSGADKLERLAIARDARTWDRLSSSLDELEALARRHGAGDDPVDAVVFRHELLTVLDAVSSRPAAARAAAVRVAQLREIAGEELDLLVVLDANDGVLPRPDLPDPVVPDALWAALEKGSRGAVTPTVRGERRVIDLAVLAAGASDAAATVLAYVREDSSGAPLGPSVIVDALERCGTAVVPAARDEAVSLDAAARLRAERELERESFFLDPARPQTRVVGKITPSSSARAVLVAATGGAERPLAVTSLERIARCPFMGYAHAVLGAREIELRQELPDAREEGTALHEALAAAFTTTRAEWPKRPRDPAAILERGLAAAEATLVSLDGRSALRAVVRMRVRDAVRAVLLEAVADEAWDFLVAEQAFGMRPRGAAETPDAPSAWPAHEIASEGERVLLRGTIDRIDTSHDGTRVRVTDYKRSASTVRDAMSAVGETAIQVPLYATVAERTLGKPPTGRYLPTQARDLLTKPSARARAGMDDVLVRPSPDAFAPIERRALALVADLRAGHLAPIPADGSQCTFCSVSGACRKPRFAMAPADDDEENGA